MKRTIIPKFFKKSTNEREKQVLRGPPKERLKEFGRKKMKYSQMMKKKNQSKKDQSKNKQKGFKRKTKRLKQVNGKNNFKVNHENFQDIKLSEMNPYNLGNDDHFRIRNETRISKSRNLDKKLVTLKSQDFDQVFRLKKEFDNRQKNKKKKNSYLSSQPIGVLPLNNNYSIEKRKKNEVVKHFTQNKGDLKESEILSSKLASKSSSVSLEKRKLKNNYRMKSGLKYQKKKSQNRPLSINSTSSSEEVTKEKKFKKDQKRPKARSKLGRGNRSGFDKLKKIDPNNMMMFTMKSKNQKQFAEMFNEQKDQSRYSSKRMKVIKKKSNFQNFMEKLEKIDKEEYRKRQKVDKQKEERVKNEYFCF